MLPSFARAGSDDGAAPAGGETTTLPTPTGGWTATVLGPTPVGTTSSTFFGDGSYVIYPGGQVYLTRRIGSYQGQYGAVALPAGFPQLTLGADPIAVVPTP